MKRSWVLFASAELGPFLGVALVEEAKLIDHEAMAKLDSKGNCSYNRTIIK